MIYTRAQALAAIKTPEFAYRYGRAHARLKAGEITTLEDLIQEIGIAGQALKDWLAAGKECGALREMGRDHTGRSRVSVLGTIVYKTRPLHS